MNKREALQATDETLKLARDVKDNLVGSDKGRHIVGVSNLAAWGRAVTTALQRLRHAVPDFDEWYELKQKEMKEDELCAYFYKLRTDSLKKGEHPKFDSVVHIGKFDAAGERYMERHRPPGAIASFIGDWLGGSGWYVRLDDGTIEDVYVDLPAEWGMSATVQFHDHPQSHLGQDISMLNIQQCGQLYYAYLVLLVREAHERWDNN